MYKPFEKHNLLVLYVTNFAVFINPDTLRTSKGGYYFVMEADTATTDVPVVQVSEKIEGKDDLIKVMPFVLLSRISFS